MNKDSTTLKINGKEVLIEKLPLRRIAEVFKALEKLPEKLSTVDFQNTDNEKLLKMLPSLIGDILPEVASLISIATPLEEKEILDEMGIAEVIEVITAIFEVNQISKVGENIKKLTARKPKQA